MTIVLTDRTYRVLDLARRQADQRSADEIESRDILDGLGMEGSGVAANVMRRLRLPFVIDSVSESLARTVMEPLNRRIQLSELCGEASDLMLRARDEALYCFERWSDPPVRSPWIGTEHVLLAITSGGEESGTILLRDALAESNRTLGDVRSIVLEVVLGRSSDQ